MGPLPNPKGPPNGPSGRQAPDETGTSETFQGVSQGVSAPSVRASATRPDAPHDTHLTPGLTVQKDKKPAPYGHSDDLTPCKGGASTRVEVCAFCGQSGKLYPTAYGDAEAVLHPGCRDAWIATYEASRNRPMGFMGSSR
jgi:hypothetical protein